MIVGVSVTVGESVSVGVSVKVDVKAPVSVAVAVAVAVLVLVRVEVWVGVLDWVKVEVAVLVFVGGRVFVGAKVAVGVGTTGKVGAANLRHPSVRASPKDNNKRGVQKVRDFIEASGSFSIRIGPWSGPSDKLEFYHRPWGIGPSLAGKVRVKRFNPKSTFSSRGPGPQGPWESGNVLKE